MIRSTATGRCARIGAALMLLAWRAAGPAPMTAHAADESLDDEARVEFFEKKVRPLLVARCHQCHGHDKPKGNLRLDSRAGVLTGGDSGPAVVAGKPDESLLVDAIRYGDTYQMPPKSQLPPEEIATLVEWVRLGVPWGIETAPTATGQGSAAGDFDLAARAGHWSLQPIVDARPPDVSDVNWIKTPVDRFILARLEAAGLAPAPAADKRALLRRVTFDLIGLPPTPAEIDDFLADESDLAYARVVDRLLASPRYGERWARHWLDLVRYAETYGHEFDFDMPNAYRYRDYVIRALNADLPYDQFVVEHIAGDLLDPPRRNPQAGFNESIIATGCYLFGEAKHSPVDVRQDEADRIDNQIDVLCKTFLGLTVSCARCHDHKFDAISTKDYYALAGYLQSSRYQQAFIDAPERLAPTIDALAELSGQKAAECVAFVRDSIAPQLSKLAATLVAGPGGAGADAWSSYLHDTARGTIDDPMHAWAVLAEPPAEESATDFGVRRARLAAQLKQQPADAAADAADAPIVFTNFDARNFGDWIATGPAFGRRPARPLDWSLAATGGSLPGRLNRAFAADSGAISATLQGVIRSPTFEIVRPKIAYRLRGTGGHVRLVVDGLQLIRNPIYGHLEFDPGGAGSHWHEQDVSKWLGHRAYIEVIDDGDGYVALEQVVFTSGAAPTPCPNRLVAAMLDDASITSPAELAARYQSLFESVLSAWLENPQAQPADADDRAAIIDCLLERPWLDAGTLQEQLASLRSRVSPFEERRRELEAKLGPPQRALALADGTAENEHVFIRGNSKTLGEEVPRRFLEVLGGARFEPPASGSGRLELARQMVSPGNPLVARVIVNRLWHHHFGAGIVRSVDNFGAMGQPPTHPALLDYLATELAREAWSLKHMHRLLVLSNTYRMSSRAQPKSDQADPQNKLWHRREVRRLEAEAIRDAMLAVSGRLDLTMYGPGVAPYLTDYMTGRGRPIASGPLDGDGRRSIYLAVRRNFLPPMFVAFDYPTPFTTIGRRGSSNVPAQALAMMNNPLVVEQARHWALRVLAEPNRSTVDRLTAMHLTALGRPPDDAELRAARAFVTPEAPSSERAAAIGSSPGDLQSSSPESAAERAVWADYAHVLLNLKEFIFIP